MINTAPVRLSDPRFITDRVGFYEWLRAEYGPVVPLLVDGDTPAWLVIGYRELHHVLSTPSVFARSSRRWNGWNRLPGDSWLLPVLNPLPNMLFAEGEDHRRRSAAVEAALGGVDPHELRAVVARIADRLIDGFCGNSRADLRADYAAWMPRLTIGWMYGMEDQEADRAARAMSVLFDTSEAGAHRAYQDLMSQLAMLVHSRRKHPGPDVVSRLAAGRAEYTDEELTAEIMAILGSGDQTTAEWIGNALRLMLTDERFSASFSGARSNVRDALAEVLWEDSPSQMNTGRYVAHDVELGSRLLRSGDMVVLGYGAANRDPRVRAGAPVGSGQANHAHLSFSHGPHACPYAGRGVAETIATTAVEILLDRLPDVELAIPAEDVRWRPSPMARGVLSLPVTFTPSTPRGAF